MTEQDFNIWEGVYENWDLAPADDDVFASDIWVDKIYQQDYVMIFNKNFTKIFAGQEESLYDDGSKTIRKYNYKNEEVGYRGDDLYYLIDYMSPLYYRLEE